MRAIEIHQLGEVIALTWTCPTCAGTLQVPLVQKLNPYGGQGKWSCPVCQEGTTEQMQVINRLILALQDALRSGEPLGIALQAHH